ncbi:MAG: NAD(P)H-hydrate dehydratase [Halanaerobiales bacterium]
MIVLRPEEMKEMDKKTIENGYPEILLMEAAGRGVAQICSNQLKNNNRVLIFCGKGNNGGDGLVAARFLNRKSFEVEIISTAKKSELKGVTLKNFELCQMHDLTINLVSEMNFDEVKDKISHSDIIIDAMLGTGLKGNLRGNIAEIVDLINKFKQPTSTVIAVDIPTGISGKNGTVLGNAIKADYTATMAFLKVGLCVYPGKKYTGEIEIIDIGMPEKTSKDKIDYNHFLLNEKEASSLLPVRSEVGHKGTFGRIGIIGGSRGMSGAPYLSGHAALKTGAGLVKLAVPESIQDIVASYIPELLTRGIDDDANGIIRNDLSSIKEFMQKQRVLAVGPGLGKSKAAKIMVKYIMEEFENTLVLDADGINLIGKKELKKRESPLIITPHPGEMARLLDKTIKEIQNNRINISREIATRYNIYLILKGAASIVALPDGKIYINPTGNNGMATAGSGDVLTGIISGLIGQGLDCIEASVLGVYLHGLAGDIAREKFTSQGVKAGDLIKSIPESISYLQNLHDN